MNDILQLKGQYQKRSAPGGGGPVNLPKGKSVTSEHISNICRQLRGVLNEWKNNQVIGGALVSVHYNRVVPKSNRLQILLSEGSTHPNYSIRGAKFIKELNGDKQKIKHVFTHFLSLDSLMKSVQYLEKCAWIVENNYKGQITDIDTQRINEGKFDDSVMKRTTFLKTLVDSYFVESFQIDSDRDRVLEESIITIYKTGINTIELLSNLGIEINSYKMIDDTTFRLEPREIDILKDKAPYLIAMSVRNFAEIAYNPEETIPSEEKIVISAPTNEPTVGVIDTLFDQSVYFSEWVKYQSCIDENIEPESKDYFHGTAVSSIIVDGPAFNPLLEDECGRFQVRHFGVATAGGFSSFTILRSIRRIVKENPDIKVWNLSLGSAMEINENFISPEAAELDKIQNEYDVIFVVAGTNRKRNSDISRIGAPADSLNSLVVNAVNASGQSASYSRKGPVLSFFYKPDICCYGGDADDKIVVCEPMGRATVSGTSFAAPWITRKIAYLIHIMGLSREVAKALIIDSAAGWDRKDNKQYIMGYGIVPTKISDILQSRDDEIRFIMSGVIDEYEVYTYNIPVPQDMNAHPFFAKATLAYFPKCNRNQGVDYTSTEMDIHFGRIMEQKGKAVIKAIDYNRQAEEGINIIYEEDARKLYRKWDNVKHICESIKDGAKPRKAYQSGMWGLSIKTKERMEAKAGRGLQFGVIVTLREMNGVNRINDFIKMCMLKGWVVNRLDVHNQIDVYVKAEEEVTFE